MRHRMFKGFRAITVAGSESSLYFAVIIGRYVDRIQATHRPQLVRRCNREIGTGVFGRFGCLRQGIIQVMIRGHNPADGVSIFWTLIHCFIKSFAIKGKQLIL